MQWESEHTHTHTVNLVKVQSLCRYVETFRHCHFFIVFENFHYAKQHI